MKSSAFPRLGVHGLGRLQGSWCRVQGFGSRVSRLSTRFSHDEGQTSPWLILLGFSSVGRCGCCAVRTMQVSECVLDVVFDS
jgi:hypothetical protein